MSCKFWFLLLSLWGLNSCFWRGIFIRASKTVITEVEASFFQESDLQLAKESIPTLIKFSEGLFGFYPKSSYYSGKLCFLYAAYAFSFLDRGYFDDFSPADQQDYDRMVKFYDRAFLWGVKTMEIRFPSSQKFLKNPIREEFPQITIKEKDVEFLFWFSLSWAMKIFHNTSDPVVVSQLQGLEKMIQVLLQHPGYLHGVIYSIPMALYGGRSAALGGNLDRAEKFYRDGNDFSNQKLLIFDYIRMRFIATQFDDEKIFEESYKKIKEFSIKDSPRELIFLNTLVKQKAKVLFENKKELF